MQIQSAEAFDFPAFALHIDERGFHFSVHTAVAVDFVVLQAFLVIPGVAVAFVGIRHYTLGHHRSNDLPLRRVFPPA